jgi:vacuolar-type H+-ATPase subunit E/Vma4
MTSESRLREAIQDSLKQLREQHAAALDAVVNTFIEAAVADCEAEIAEARAQAEASAHQTLETSLAEARTDADQALAGALREARAEANQALAGALQEAQSEADTALAVSVSSARALEREADLAGISRLLDATRALDEASSLTDVLDTLTERAAHEADRVGVLLVRGDRLRGWRLTGFGDEAPDARSVELTLDDAGIIVEAVRSKSAKTAGPELSGFGFAPLPAGRAALAVPVEVGGRVVAVVYADDAASESGTVPSAWPEVVEILARHAARCLEALTVLHTGAAPPPASTSSASEGTVVGNVS